MLKWNDTEIVFCFMAVVLRLLQVKSDRLKHKSVTETWYLCSISKTFIDKQYHL